MLFRHHPTSALSAFVESIWVTERDALTHTRERSLPTGCVDIVIPLRQDSIVRYASVVSDLPLHFRGAVLQGPHDRFSVRGTGGPSMAIGVHFKPGGAAAFFGGALPELRNRTVLLEEVWGQQVAEIRQRLQASDGVTDKVQILEHYLLRRLADTPSHDPMVVHALSALRADPCFASIAEIQRASGCSPARFIRRFVDAVGLTPKRYMRVQRLSALLPTIVRRGPRDWAAVAVDAGFFDQSHLINEFRRITGVTPMAYLPTSADQPMHVPLLDRNDAGAAKKSPIR